VDFFSGADFASSLEGLPSFSSFFLRLKETLRIVKEQITLVQDVLQGAPRRFASG
jgi:hypothetical protein